MIPIRDDIPSRTVPVVNVALIIINVLAFLYEITLGSTGLDVFLRQYAVIPARYFAAGYLDQFGLVHHYGMTDLVIPIFTAMFLHGGWVHVGGNMLYLWIFGDNVEDRVGHGRYLIFYLLCGVLATMAHIMFNPESKMPSLGASGAIAGVLGAYILLYPRARVITLIPIFFFIEFIPIPAVVLLGIWFLQQFFAGAMSLSVPSAQTGGVAWWAHIGGFLAGMLLVNLFKRRDYFPVERDLWWRDRY
jgi:membrane associated rhomboid family serine protease